ncbi:MAG: DNA polymerase III subunit gamma/tau [Chloroflexota bacterium]|nr:DNA polymerase III subunit gamma/tau [Chloroflexota bacterium]
MASQSLYRKWRSQTFNELVGQEPVVRTLQNALSSGKLAHAYLFTGPRGTGKTTTARLLAKTINCLNPQNGEPCNVCQQCREITAGTSFDVIEIDAASNRGIDSIRDLREKVMMRPSSGKYKVYVLDEAHMLTTEAFNALLKTLEEPPDYAVFVLATTDVHKLLPTVLSRCQRFDFKRITTRQIVAHLNYVASEEGVKLEPGAAELIARAAAGGMRDALSLLDQSIAYAGTEIALTQVQAMLGVADPRTIHTLIAHIAEGDSSAGLHLLNDLAEAGADLRQVNAQTVEYWRALMLARAGADIAAILDRTEDEVREIDRVARLFALEELTECARIFAQNELIQKNQGTPQLGLELAFLACVEVHRRAQSAQPFSAATPPVVVSPVPVQPAPARRPAAIPPPVEIRAAPPEVESNGRSASSSQAIEMPERRQLSPVSAAKEVAGTPERAQPPAASDDIVVAETAQENQAPPTLTLEEAKKGWDNVKRRVRQKDAKLQAWLNGCTIIAIEGTAESPLVVMQASSGMHYENVNKGERYQVIEWALALEFNQKCRARVVPPEQVLSMSNSRMPVSDPASPYAAIAPRQQAARRGRSNSQPSPAPSPDPEPVEKAAEVILRPQPPELPPATHSHEDDSPPLARTKVVRENIIEPPRSSWEPVEQYAQRNQVVQAVVKTFGAHISDIQPK